jgi:predicted nucleic acid-binding protein
VTVVADAGPLIHLSLVGRINLLPLLYGRILIPDLVYQEVVQKGEGLAGSAEISAADWIDIAPYDPGAHLFRLLRADLDPGEAAALWLAVEKRSEWILSDDRPARLAAERLGLKVRGTLGILVAAKRRGLLPTVAPLLHELKAKGVWLSEDLIERVLRDLGESES